MCRALVAALALFVSLPLHAALDCYVDTCLPAVARLDRTAAGLRGIVSGKWTGATPLLRTLVFDGERWREGTPIRKPLMERPSHCPAAFNGRDYAETNDSEAARGPEAVCAESGNIIYGGLQFYDGEGFSGRGGLLRYDRRSGAVEVRRLELLRDVSVNSIAAAGDTVWFGTTRLQECIGQPFVHGVVQYDWATGAIATWEGSDDGPLGFATYDLDVDGDSLWVATELGISRLDRATGVWHHYVPQEKDGRIDAPERRADHALREFLQTVPAECLRSETFENQLVRGLALFRPRFLRSYLQTRPAAEWTCDELRFLASRMPDFATLDRRLLRVRPPRRDDFHCVVEGFGEKKHVEREWRDLLVAQWNGAERPRFSADAFRYFRGDDELARMLASSRQDDAIAVVALIVGEKAVPLLAPILGSDDLRLRTAAAVYGLELATHRKVSPDGSVEALPSGSDQPWYAERVTYDDFVYHRWFRWNAEQRSAVVAAWRQWLRDHDPR